MLSIALINKETNTCDNIVVFEDMQTAIDMLGKQYIITQAKEGFWIGDIYKDGNWSKSTPIQGQTEPTAEEYLLDFEYRLSVLELGGNA